MANTARLLAMLMAAVQAVPALCALLAPPMWPMPIAKPIGQAAGDCCATAAVEIDTACVETKAPTCALPAAGDEPPSACCATCIPVCCGPVPAVPPRDPVRDRTARGLEFFGVYFSGGSVSYLPAHRPAIGAAHDARAPFAPDSHRLRAMLGVWVI